MTRRFTFVNPVSVHLTSSKTLMFCAPNPRRTAYDHFCDNKMSFPSNWRFKQMRSVREERSSGMIFFDLFSEFEKCPLARIRRTARSRQYVGSWNKQQRYARRAIHPHVASWSVSRVRNLSIRKNTSMDDDWDCTMSSNVERPLFSWALTLEQGSEATSFVLSCTGDAPHCLISWISSCTHLRHGWERDSVQRQSGAPIPDDIKADPMKKDVQAATGLRVLDNWVGYTWWRTAAVLSDMMDVGHTVDRCFVLTRPHFSKRRRNKPWWIPSLRDHRQLRALFMWVDLDNAQKKDWAVSVHQFPAPPTRSVVRRVSGVTVWVSISASLLHRSLLCQDIIADCRTLIV